VNFWWRADPPLWSMALAPAAMAYRAGAALHRAISTPCKARLPVISVGNIAVGGQGKTPVTLAIAQRLIARGRKPIVLSRGYGRLSREDLLVTADADVRLCGDEPLLLARRGVPVVVGPYRYELARRDYRDLGVDVILLDDGLQHHALARDLDVIVADASNPLGNGCLLPRGPLREEPGALRRVKRGLLWLTRCDLPRDPRTQDLIDLGFPVVESAFTASADLRGKRAFLFAGIARPPSFEATVRGLGAEIAGARWFRDHHFFSAKDLAQVRREAQGSGADVVVTTEKDFVRLDDTAGIVPVPVELRISRGEDALEDLLP
jgi:tetraacyldisaccharide 4'-kinase